MDRQTNLRKRVSVLKYFEQLPAGVRGDTAKTYDFATHYSYDMSGNVKTLTHEFVKIPVPEHVYKRIDYDYDMLSGKVNMLSYSRGFTDQFYHKFTYDADNRITDAQVSMDGIYWDADAHYEYYQHGPLARATIGDLNLQGMDYAYTIQGWIKSMNADMIDTSYDMGQDGTDNSAFSKDLFSYSLNYFKGDYRPIANTPLMHIADINKSLYNGNIARQTTSLAYFNTLGKEYRYDPLNRLKNTQYYAIDTQNNNHLDPIQAYRNSYTYDEDGNIARLTRMGGEINGTASLMDSFVLQHGIPAGGGGGIPAVLNNRLTEVFDDADASDVYSGDIDYASVLNGWSVRTFYDASGRMIKDNINGQDTSIWSMYNKQKHVSIANGTKMDFFYDGAGNRVEELVTSPIVNNQYHRDHDYYVRDNDGNILAVLRYSEQLKQNWTLLHPVEAILNNNPGVTLGDIAGIYAADQNFVSGIVAATAGVTTLSNTLIGNLNAADYYADKAYFDPCLVFTRAYTGKILGDPDAIGVLSDAVRSAALRQFTDNHFGGDDNTAIGASVWKATASDLYIQFCEANSLSTEVTEFAGSFVDNPELYKASLDMFLDSQGSAMNDVVKGLLVNERVMSIFNETTDQEAITRAADLWSQTDMDGFSVFCASYDMPTDPGSFMEAFKNDFTGNRIKLSTYIATHSSEEGMSNTLKTWFGDADLNSFYRDDALADAWDEDKWHALHVYTEEPEHDAARSTIISLLASGENALQDLRAIYGDKTMLQTRYRNNPATYLSTYLASQGAEGLAAGLQAIPGMSGAKLIVDITQALGPKALAGYYEEEVVGESFGLAEQHLYGSKRLGIKYYWPTMWWYWDSVTHYRPIANTWTVATVPWYSSNWGDFIKPLPLPNPGSFNWLNSVDYSQWFTNRILGLKKYELSDYLGNVQAVIFDRHTPVVEADTITRYEADPYQMLDYYPYGMLMRQGYCDTCVGAESDNSSGVLASSMMRTWTDDPITPESYPPQTNALIANWFVAAPESWKTKLKMEWMGSGGAMNFSCLALISSSAGDVGMAAGIATDPETAYTVTFNTDNGNAGTLTARIIHYNNSSHTTYTLLREISVSRSSQNHISFTATGDSVWLWVGHKANGTSLAAGTTFKVTSGSILRYTWSVAQSHIQSYLYNYGAYRFAYNGQERTDEKAGKGNFYTAKFWEYGSRTADRELPDPKSTFGISPYAVFGGNPIVNMDPFGDTTIAYNLQGVKIGTLNDNLKNQVHFFNVDADKGAELINKLNSLKPKERDAWAGAIRKHSVAYMGEKSSASLKGLAEKSIKTNLEIGFVTTISSSKEIIFKEIPSDPNYPPTSSSFDLRPAVEKYYGSKAFDILGFGHTHFDNTNIAKLTPEQSLNQYAEPTWDTQWDRSTGNVRSVGIDMTPVLSVGRSYGETLHGGLMTPLFISTAHGVGLYNPDTKRGGTLKLSYKWFSNK